MKNTITLSSAESVQRLVKVNIDIIDKMYLYECYYSCVAYACNESQDHCMNLQSLITAFFASVQMYTNINELVLEIGQNFQGDHRFCKTDWSSINNRFVEKYIHY